MTVFIDSATWFAAIFTRDANNRRAKQLLRSHPDWVTTDLVVAETWGLICRRLNYHAAERYWSSMIGGAVRILPVKQQDWGRAWAIGQIFPDQKFSLVDRTSFAVMERLGLTRVITFDKHFVVYRYGHNRDKAFEVLR